MLVCVGILLKASAREPPGKVDNCPEKLSITHHTLAMSNQSVQDGTKLYMRPLFWDTYIPSRASSVCAIIGSSRGATSMPYATEMLVWPVMLVGFM